LQQLVVIAAPPVDEAFRWCCEQQEGTSVSLPIIGQAAKTTGNPTLNRQNTNARTSEQTRYVERSVTGTVTQLFP
jgi:hypothetical protein